MIEEYQNKMLTNYVVKNDTVKGKRNGIYFTVNENVLVEFKELAKENKLNVNKTMQKYIDGLILQLKNKKLGKA